MAKKEEISKDLKELKTKLQEGKVVIGNDRVMKGLRNKTLSKVLLASNVPKSIKEDINHYAKLAETSVSELDLDNEELGLFCKKNFLIVVLGTEK